jgi:hypothetical protein
VLNRPTAGCLAGPNWRAEQWTLAAARLGIPTQTRHCIAGRHAHRNFEEAYEITAVGEQCFGCRDTTLRTNTLRLARAAGVDLLSVWFSRDDGRFLSANIWPQLTDAAVAVAVRETLENRRENRR